MDHVGIVVDDLAAATAFFVELGLQLRGETKTSIASATSAPGRDHRRTCGTDRLRASGR
jgi:catechol 2,3-dioxygenase-like lactoylglutathione lyase family enzyme